VITVTTLQLQCVDIVPKDALQLATGVMKIIIVKTTNYNLRPRADGFTLPEKDTCNFIPWMLFERIYC